MELSRRGRGSVGDATNNERFIGLVIFCCFLLLTFILVLATTDPSKDLQLRMPAKTRIPLKDDEVTKVLILAYPRSGSTYAASLVAAPEDASYIFEPLFNLDQTSLKGWKSGFDWELFKEAEWLIDDLFRCGIGGMAVLKTHDFWRNAAKGLRSADAQAACKETSPRIIKTVRLRRYMSRQWLIKSKFKIIHLVRDPRAMYNSMTKENETWFDILSDYEYHCSTISDDLELKKELPRSRYLRVRYEDLVDHTYRTLKRIYRFMGEPLTEHVTRTAWEHSHFKQASQTDYQVNSGYYFTYVRPDFVHDRWKTELNSTLVQQVESQCAPLMKKMKYKNLTRTISNKKEGAER